MERAPDVCIVDYGLGNLFSIESACHWAGMDAKVSASPQEILKSDVVILPGVGAFGDAMDALHRLDLVEPIKEVARSQKRLVGICLGMQLLMTESYEFGTHQGLGLIDGAVVRFNEGTGPDRRLKVPQVGWNRIFKAPPTLGSSQQGNTENDRWSGTPLHGIADGEHLYFVHSFYVEPQDPEVVLSVTRYGETGFCSSMQFGNIFAAQFHPERSGQWGLEIYRNICRLGQPAAAESHA